MINIRKCSKKADMIWQIREEDNELSIELAALRSLMLLGIFPLEFDLDTMKEWVEEWNCKWGDACTVAKQITV